MSEEAAFLRAVQANPNDVAVRLVYADWLEERGDPRGEYLRIACALSSPTTTPSGKGPKPRPRRATLWARLQTLRPTLDIKWLARVGGLFHFLAATNARERMDELEHFIEFWYGPWKPEYGEPESRLRKLPLPYPLRRFYAFAGRWPAPDPGHGMEFFYTGAGGHHLHDLDSVKLQRKRLDFFMEYQGDWDGWTLPDEDDPPVWIRGYWEEDAGGQDDEEEGSEKTKQVSSSLSGFLVTHFLMTTLYEWENSPSRSYDERLGKWFRRSRDKTRIWTAEEGGCPSYEGVFYLFAGNILVHQSRSSYRFGALRPAGVKLLEQRLKAHPARRRGRSKRR
jgi:uncharacterized protein (TIGR02996 family)